MSQIFPDNHQRYGADPGVKWQSMMVVPTRAKGESAVPVGTNCLVTAVVASVHCLRCLFVASSRPCVHVPSILGFACSCRRRERDELGHSWTWAERGGRSTLISRSNGPRMEEMSMLKSWGSQALEVCRGG